MAKYYGRPSYGEWFRKAKQVGRKRKKYVPRKPSGKAAVLTTEQFNAAEQWALDHSLYPQRDQLLIQLSRYCALRAKEIATLWVGDITDAEGKVIDRVEISKRGAKYGRTRTVPMRPLLIENLRTYFEQNGIDDGPIFWSHRGVPLTSNAVQKRLKEIYKACGFKGARSHSGRRSAITAMARRISTIGATMEDIRIFAGHAYLQTTQEYIEPNPEAQSKMIYLIP